MFDADADVKRMRSKNNENVEWNRLNSCETKTKSIEFLWVGCQDGGAHERPKKMGNIWKWAANKYDIDHHT